MNGHGAKPTPAQAMPTAAPAMPTPAPVMPTAAPAAAPTDTNPGNKTLAPGLYLVATPIGNLEDISLRALRVLRSVDRIACEDTRETQKLLHHFGITTPTVSYHLHNERSRAEELVAALRLGERIAVVSDAGTPGIADPGVAIVSAAIAAGIPVFSVPGPNAAISALISSGLRTEAFTFRGFLPSKSGERRSSLEAVRNQLRAQAPSEAPSQMPSETQATGGGKAPSATQIFYETPHRIAGALADVEAVFGPAHRIALARELTKLHEEVLRGTVAEVRAAIGGRTGNLRGEMVLMLSGELALQDADASTVAQAVAARMRSADVSEKEALKQIARERGLGKSEAYREWQRTRTR